MNKKQYKEFGKQGSDKRWAKRYEAIAELSKHVNKNDLNWIQAKWKTEHLLKLLEAYKHDRPRT